MKIDQHPFAMNMVDMARDKGPSQAKILTSSSAKKSGTVDPKAQITADEVVGAYQRHHREIAMTPVDAN